MQRIAKEPYYRFNEKQHLYRFRRELARAGLRNLLVDPDQPLTCGVTGPPARVSPGQERVMLSGGRPLAGASSARPGEYAVAHCVETRHHAVSNGWRVLQLALRYAVCMMAR